jgi:hypothetical protein
MSQMPFEHDVFVSYCSKDKATVLELAARLRSDDLDVWLDEWGLHPGANIPGGIEKALDRSRVLVLCWSRHAATSDWAAYELNQFQLRDPLNREGRLIPVRLDGSPLRSSLRQIRHVDWSDKDDTEYEKLLAACRRVIEGASNPSGEGHGPAASSWLLPLREKSLWSQAPLVVDRVDVAPILVDRVSRAWAASEAARAALPANGWVDRQLPLRVVHRIGQLAEGAGVELSAWERAVAIFCTFLFEEAFANGVVRFASQADVYNLEPQPTAGPERSLLEITHRSNPQLVRRAQSLSRAGKTGEAELLCCWMVCQTLLGRSELLTPHPEGWLPPGLLGLEPEADARLKRIFPAERMLLFSGTFGVSADFLSRRWETQKLHTKQRLGEGVRQVHLREPLVAFLQALGCHMALDPRRLSPVLAAHVGVSDPLDLPEFCRSLDAAEWQRVVDRFELAIHVRHPAEDVALNQQIDQLKEIVDQLSRARDGGLLQDIRDPLAFSSDGIHIVHDQYGPAFVRPHVRFEIDAEKIQRLLMGERLYGDPRVAVRELYQNALDACRYRAAREAYLDIPTPRPGVRWAGEIKIWHSTDPVRGSFIECSDNGVGMALRHIRSLFARAGQRYCESSEFQEEEARWRVHGIRVFPNSCFGIGVLSYFLLADEVEIETCWLDPKGRPSQNLHAIISSSGGLFRVMERGIGTKAGSRVRLWLRNNDRARSAIEYLDDLFWRSEFQVQIQERTSGAHDLIGARDWREYASAIGSGTRRRELRPLAAAETLATHHPDVFWSFRGGHLLSDGLRVARLTRTLDMEALTPAADAVRRPGADVDVGFAIVDLRGEHAASLSVDRARVLSWDRDWVLRVLEDPRSSRALVRSSGVTVAWLYHRVAIPAIIDHIAISFIEANQAFADQFPVHRLGLFRTDLDLVSSPPELDASAGDVDTEWPTPRLARVAENWTRGDWAQFAAVAPVWLLDRLGTLVQQWPKAARPQGLIEQVRGREWEGPPLLPSDLELLGGDETLDRLLKSIPTRSRPVESLDASREMMRRPSMPSVARDPSASPAPSVSQYYRSLLETRMPVSSQVRASFGSLVKIWVQRRSPYFRPAGIPPALWGSASAPVFETMFEWWGAGFLDTDGLAKGRSTVLLRMLREALVAGHYVAPKSELLEILRAIVEEGEFTLKPLEEACSSLLSRPELIDTSLALARGAGDGVEPALMLLQVSFGQRQPLSIVADLWRPIAHCLALPLPDMRAIEPELVASQALIELTTSLKTHGILPAAIDKPTAIGLLSSIGSFWTEGARFLTEFQARVKAEAEAWEKAKAKAKAEGENVDDL